jgi:hypothetical protein
MNGGYDEELIKKALSTQNLSYFYSKAGVQV